MSKVRPAFSEGASRDNIFQYFADKVKINSNACISAQKSTLDRQNVVHATASPQWLAGRPSHPFRGGPSASDSLWTRLGPDMYENGRSSLQHRRKGAIRR